jgi:hypothetical protein
MATGILGTADLAAGTLATVYTVPDDTFCVASVSVVNRGNTSIGIRLAVAATDTPTDAEWLEFDTPLDAKGVLERTGMVLQAGKKIVVRSTAINANAVAFGIETSVPAA